MKILMVSSEAVPFAKTGGLADAVSALAKNLSAKKHDVRIIIPRYYHIDRSNLTLSERDVSVDMGGYEIHADIYTAQLSGTKVSVYFIDCRRMNWIPDIMHSHDWSGALVPVLLKYGMCGPEFKNTSSIFTIHNMGYQGSYPIENFNMLGMSYDDVCRVGLEYFGRLNFLKGAVGSANIITTVSPTYAHEIQTAAGGFGLDGLMRVRSDSLVGILNGADTSDWNPSVDKYIPAAYDINNMSGKKICRQALQKHFGLPEDDKPAIVAMVTRLVSQKGISEVFAPMYGCLYKICTELNSLSFWEAANHGVKTKYTNLSGNFPILSHI